MLVRIDTASGQNWGNPRNGRASKSIEKKLMARSKGERFLDHGCSWGGSGGKIWPEIAVKEMMWL
jgi:hypothetical protein